MRTTLWSGFACAVCGAWGGLLVLLRLRLIMARRRPVPELKGTYLSAFLAWVHDARSSDGRLNAELVAAGEGVSAQTVRRWVREGFPVDRSPALWREVGMPLSVLEEQERKARQAVEVARAFHRDELAPNVGWTESGWLEPHWVELVELDGRSHLCLARVTRAGAEYRTRSTMYGARTLDELLVPNRFIADAMKHDVLDRVGPWRVRVQPGFIARGSTEAWLPGAPLPALKTVRRSLAARGVARQARTFWD